MPLIEKMNSGKDERKYKSRRDFYRAKQPYTEIAETHWEKLMELEEEKGDPNFFKNRNIRF